MDVAAKSSSIMYIVFAGSISINKKRIASNYSTPISCRNSPHRQLKFAIGHNSSLIAILRMHVSAFNAHRPSGTYPLSISIMASVMGSSYIQYKYFYFVIQACLLLRQEHH
jgi:hypothetical protein